VILLLTTPELGAAIVLLILDAAVLDELSSSIVYMKACPIGRVG